MLLRLGVEQRVRFRRCRCSLFRLFIALSKTFLGYGVCLFGSRRQVGEHLVDQFGEQGVGLFVGGVEMMDLALGVNDEDLAQTGAHGSVAYRVCVAVTEPRIERIPFVREKIPNVFQCGNLEHLRLPVDDLSLERADEAVRAHDDGAVGHVEDLVLDDAPDVVPGGVCLPYGSRGQVEELVVVLLDGRVQLGDAFVAPVLAQAGQDMAEHVALSDRAIDVRDYDPLAILPKEDASADRLPPL